MEVIKFLYIYIYLLGNADLHKSHMKIYTNSVNK